MNSIPKIGKCLCGCEVKGFYINKRLLTPRQFTFNGTDSSSFRGDFSFLSNFANCVVFYEGIQYPTAEHAYQASKYPKEKRTDCLFMTPKAVKIWGKKGFLPSNLFEIMEEIIMSKFSCNIGMAYRLCEIEGTIIEYNTWHDNKWGICMCKQCTDRRKIRESALFSEGKTVDNNNMGKILMRVKNRLLKNGSDIYCRTCNRKVMNIVKI